MFLSLPLHIQCLASIFLLIYLISHLVLYSPESLLHNLFYHVLSSLTSQKAITMLSHCPQSVLTHHRTPLRLTMSRESRGARECSEGAGKSCNRSKFSYCSGAFLLSLCFLVLLFPSGHFLSSPVKAKKTPENNKACGTLSQPH